jgi:hypothetical protein
VRFQTRTVHVAVMLATYAPPSVDPEERGMKRFALLAAVAVAMAATGMQSTASAARPGPHPAASTIAVYGDAPYGAATTIVNGAPVVDTSQFNAMPAFLDSINQDPDVGLVVHVGDIHAGKQFCTQTYDESILSQWTALTDPLVYTPGDNEWADCHKAAEGGHVHIDGAPVDYADGDPIANLDLVRDLFFANPGQSLGGAPISVISQANVASPEHPTDANYVENVMWRQSGVVFVTLNIPGGSNNDQDVWFPQDGNTTETAAQTREREQRTGADLRWLDAAFTLAQDTSANGLVIVEQADMWSWEETPAHEAGYEPFVQSIAQNADDFGKPVLLFNGDSHVYRSDNPLRAKAPCTWERVDACVSTWDRHPGYNVPNFHRIVVHGSTTPLQWLKLTIDPSAHYANGPSSFGPFSWTRQQP